MHESPRIKDSSKLDEERIRLQPFSPEKDKRVNNVVKDKEAPAKANGSAAVDRQYCQSRASTSSSYEPQQSLGGVCMDHAMDDAGSQSAGPPPLYRRSPLRLLVAFLFLALSAFANFFLLVIVHDVVPKQAALPDLAFMLIPQQHWAWAAGDVLSFIACVVVITLLLFHRCRWIVLRRAFTIAGIMFGLRSLCLGTTFLPPSFHHRNDICLPQNNLTQLNVFDVGRRFVAYLLTMGLTSGEEKILCGDLMFSGHTIVFTLMYCFSMHYSPPRAWPLRWVMTPICFVGMLFMIICGGHYTIDVLIAYWLGTHVFWSYHQIFEMPARKRQHQPLTHLWWYYVCYWLESDVPDVGKLPNEFDWPLPWPESAVRATSWCSDRLQAGQEQLLPK